MTHIIRRRRLTVYRVVLLHEHCVLLLGRSTALAVHTDCPSASLESRTAIERTIAWRRQQSGKQLPEVSISELEGATAF